MLTQCPECQTTFRLRLQQLKAAGGQVRCSRCHTIFDALDHMVSTPRPSSGGETVSPATEASASTASAEPAQATSLPDAPIDSESQQDDDWLVQLAQQFPAEEADQGEQPEDAALPDTDDSTTEQDEHEQAWSVVSATEQDAVPEQDTAQTLDGLDTDETVFEESAPSGNDEEVVEQPTPDNEKVDDDFDLETSDQTTVEEGDEADTPSIAATDDETDELDLADIEKADDDFDLETSDQTTVEETDEADTPPITFKDEETDELDLASIEKADDDFDLDTPIQTTVEETDEETGILDLTSTDHAEDPLDLDTMEAFEEVDERDLASTEHLSDSTDPDALLEATQAEYDTTELDLDSDNEQGLGISVPPEEASLPADELLDLAETDDTDETVVPDAMEVFEEVDERDLASTEHLSDSTDPDALLEATQAEYDTTELDLDSDNEQGLGISVPPEEVSLPADELPVLAETDDADETVALDAMEASEEVNDTSDKVEKNDLEGWEDVEATEPALSTELATELDQANPWAETESFPDEMLPEMLLDQVDDLPVGRETDTPTEPDDATTGNELPAPEPVEDKTWDAFSEQHIESLLTPAEGEDILDETPSLEAISEPTPDSEEYASETPSPQQDVAETLEEPPEKLDEDEALLQQLLPEDDTELDQDLDRLHPHNSQDAPAPHDEEVSALASTAPHPGYSLEPETASPQSRNLAAPLLWGGGVLALIATLALQFVFYNHSQLAHHTQLRPLLDQLCQWTDCELPPQRDLGQIRLASHLVQFHPRFQDSLLITATLINRAAFTQPYPEVEIQMTDLQQRVVASRRFRPEEYLVGQRSDRPMPQNIEIPLMLEVVDPGKDVVGFRFEFY